MWLLLHKEAGRWHCTVKIVENDIRFALIKDKKAGLYPMNSLRTKVGKTIDDIARAMGLTVQEATQVNFKSYTIPVPEQSRHLLVATVAVEGQVTVDKRTNGVYLLWQII
jgi:hypothetical protein